MPRAAHSDADSDGARPGPGSCAAGRLFLNPFGASPRLRMAGVRAYSDRELDLRRPDARCRDLSGRWLEMTSTKQARLGIRFLTATAAAALSLGLDVARARSKTKTAPQEPARQVNPKPPPIPQAGPLARPKPLEQVGLPAEITRQAIPPHNPQTLEKIASAKNVLRWPPIG
jgi:hypothetical protein